MEVEAKAKNEGLMLRPVLAAEATVVEAVAEEEDEEQVTHLPETSNRKRKPAPQPTSPPKKLNHVVTGRKKGNVPGGRIAPTGTSVFVDYTIRTD